MARASAAMDVEDFILNRDLDVWQVYSEAIAGNWRKEDTGMSSSRTG